MSASTRGRTVSVAAATRPTRAGEQQYVSLAALGRTGPGSDRGLDAVRGRISSFDVSLWSLYGCLRSSVGCVVGLGAVGDLPELAAVSFGDVAIWPAYSRYRRRERHGQRSFLRRR